MLNWFGDTLKIDASLGQTSYDSIIPSRAHIFHAVSLHGVYPNELRVQIT